ncbi:PA domain protein [Ancylostoma caninum]|uniref:PA domain protein n=1 Tax=Ancylostoma caninum TaxID=29170 RepID=A0A368FN56_ANCCA|nr:PA domain protein [Ancylostoma caninum]
MTLITQVDLSIQNPECDYMAINLQMAKCGIDFMEELLHLIPQLEKEAASGMRGGRYLQLLSVPFLGNPIFCAAPAQYGSDLKDVPVVGEAVLAEPLRACSPLINDAQIRGRIAVVERSDCMFQQKTRHAQQAGAVAVVVVGEHRSLRLFLRKKKPKVKQEINITYTKQ